MKRIQYYYLTDIVNAIEAVGQFIEGYDFEAFANDAKTHTAVSKKLEDIGEAIKNLDDDLKATYPEVPWRDLARMRDHLVHRYFMIRYDFVWETVQQDFPPLKNACLRILTTLKEEEE
jgi:uncharacterized protein with HEPN domain